MLSLDASVCGWQTMSKNDHQCGFLSPWREVVLDATVLDPVLFDLDEGAEEDFIRLIRVANVSEHRMKIQDDFNKLKN